MQESSEKSRGLGRKKSLQKGKQTERKLKKAASKSSISSQDYNSADDGSTSDDDGSNRGRVITHSIIFRHGSEEESSSQDEPMADIVKKQKVRPSSGSSSKKRKSKKKSSSESGSESSSSDQPLAKKIKGKASAKPVKKPADKKAVSVKKEKPNAAGNTPTKSKPSKPAKSPKVKSEGDGEDGEVEEDYKWWEAGDLSSGLKWTTLQHQGPLFPPPYEPHGVQVKYDGKPVKLTPAAEEVASFFAALVGTDHANNPTFCKNFFIDFLKVIKDEKQVHCSI
jgi:DNA topoisomerase-1